MQMGYEMVEVNHEEPKGPLHVFSHNPNHHSTIPLQNQSFQEVLCSQPLRQDQFLAYQNQVLAFLHQQQHYHEGQQDVAVAGTNNVVPGFFFDPDLNEKNRKMRFLGEREDGFLNGDDQCVSGTRGSVLAMSHQWQNQEDSAIRQFLWKPFCTDDSQRAIKAIDYEMKDIEERLEVNQKRDRIYSEETEENSSMEEKSKLLGELEAICQNAAMNKVANQTGSSSSPSGDEHLGTMVDLPLTSKDQNHLNPIAIPEAAELEHVDPLAPAEDEKEPSRVSKKRKKTEDYVDVNAMAMFFESLVKQLMDQQEVLYRKSMEILERLDQERVEREEAWRRQETERLQQEAEARAHERALASRREATIIACLEKITGQTIKIPQMEYHQGSSKNEKIRNRDNASIVSKRWPTAEVEALRQIRESLESKFQEPGVKARLWEEISNAMASMGFQKNARRCREKWENISKYSKKLKEI